MKEAKEKKNLLKKRYPLWTNAVSQKRKSSAVFIHTFDME